MSGKLDSGYMQAIWDVTEALQDEKQMESALSNCLNILTKTIGAGIGLVWLESKDDGRLHSIASAGQADLTGVCVDASRGILGRVFQSQEIVQINNAQNSPLFSPSVDEELGVKIESTLVVPLATRASVFGCIQLINKEDGEFTESDRVLSGNLAALVSLDIEDKGYLIHYKKGKKPLIVLQNLVKEFPSGETVLRVLNSVDLTVYEQEFLVILGESGCGKTTLLNILGGMDSLTGGSMTVGGKDFSHPGEKELTEYRRDFIGFIFQAYNLMPNLTAIDNVELIAENSLDPISSEEAIGMVGLSDRRYNRPSQLSGGQQQRVSIARALVKNPKLILADEPTAALDFQTGQEVLEIVENIVRCQGKSVVMVTHNAEIAKMADRVIKLKGGQISSIRINNSPLHAAELSW